MKFNEKGQINWAPWLIGILVVAVIVLAVPLFTNQGLNLNLPNPSPVAPVGGGPGDRGVTEDQIVPITDIIANPDRYIGQRVRVQGEAETVYSDQVFKLDEEGAVFGDEILVISKNPVPSDIRQEARENVRVTGEVRILTIVEIERELSIDLDPQVETTFENTPIIIADQVTRISQ